MQVSHGKAAPLKRIKPGDRVVYYSPTVTLGARGDRETCRLGKERHRLASKRASRRRRACGRLRFPISAARPSVRAGHVPHAPRFCLPQPVPLQH
jgi:hypothetical protein